MLVHLYKGEPFIHLAAGFGPVLGTTPAWALPVGDRVTVLTHGSAGWASLHRPVTEPFPRCPRPLSPSPDVVGEHADGLVVLPGLDFDVGRAVT
ncbi:hypothetical protein GCM10009642_38470 [Nocardiopsis metallicus]|uniref:Uncharacterized protein n=1 Tax=Nocardiopsis metallicus TaxID=179819 RepID=A0A840WET4_9ACTN|nr:hypothetical protein [Nocardiopsis metallicus]